MRVRFQWDPLEVSHNSLTIGQAVKDPELHRWLSLGIGAGQHADVCLAHKAGGISSNAARVPRHSQGQNGLRSWQAIETA